MNTAVYLDPVQLRILLTRYQINGLSFYQSVNEKELTVSAVELGITRMTAQGLLTTGEDDHFIAEEALQQDMQCLLLAENTILMKGKSLNTAGNLDSAENLGDMCLYSDGNNVLTIDKDALHQDLLRLELLTLEEFAEVYGGVFSEGSVHLAVYPKGSDAATELEVDMMEELLRLLGKEGT